MSSSLALEAFINHRQLLFGIACSVLGRWSEAEDMVQEVWLRWQTQDPAEIQSPKAWLGSAMRRLCIDQLRSARHQRENQYGVVAPEELSAELDAKPHISVEHENSLALAFTLILERLRPVERVVFLLREVLDYNYADTASIVGKAEANCRQIVHRAKAQLLASSTPAIPSQRAHDLAEKFISATGTGNVHDLLALFGEDTIADNDTSIPFRAASLTVA